MPMPTFTVMTRAARRGLLLGLAAGLCVAAGASTTLARERRELPQVALTRADGAAVNLQALAQDRGWLLLVVDADAPGSQRLLTALETWSLGPRSAQVVILLQGSAAGAGKAADEWQGKLPGMFIATDVKGAARQALRVRAVPTVLGARGPWIEWQIAGVLNDPEMLRQVVISWLADDRPPA